MEGKESKKREILSAARELFSEYGYKSVSMDQIAQKAKVSKGALYLYFVDKEDLFLRLVDEILQEMNEIAEEISRKQLSLFDEIHQITYNMLILRKKQRFLYRIANEARDFGTPLSCKTLEMVEETISGYLYHLLTKAMEKGSIKTCNVEILSFIVLKLYSALAFEWEDKHNPLDEREVAEILSTLFKEGILIQR